MRVQRYAIPVVIRSIPLRVYRRNKKKALPTHQILRKNFAIAFSLVRLRENINEERMRNTIFLWIKTERKEKLFSSFDLCTQSTHAHKVL